MVLGSESREELSCAHELPRRKDKNPFLSKSKSVSDMWLDLSGLTTGRMIVRHSHNTMLRIKDLRLLPIKHKCPNLNTLPTRLILLIRIRERCMRHPLRPPIIKRIKTLDQRHFLGSLTVLEVPAMIRVGLDAVGLASAVRVDQGCAYQVAVGD